MVVAVLVAFEVVDRAIVVTVVALLVLAAVVLIVPAAELRQILDRIKRVEAGPGGVALELFDRVQDVAARAPSEEQEGKPPKAASEALELRLRLEAKLAYIVKDLLGEFATIGSLRYDGYLTEDEAQIATGVMTLRDEDLQSLPAEQRKRLTEAAAKVVGTIRASVLWGWARTAVEKRAGWNLEVLQREGQKRPDLVAIGPHGERAHLLPTFATSKGSKILAGVLNRLCTGEELPEAERRIVVLPRKSASPRTYGDADIEVIRVQELNEVLFAQ